LKIQVRDLKSVGDIDSLKKLFWGQSFEIEWEMSAREKKKPAISKAEESRAQNASASKSDLEWGGKCRESLAAAKAILNSPYLKSRSDSVPSASAVIPPKALHGLLSPSPPRDTKDMSYSLESSLLGTRPEYADSDSNFHSEDQLMLSIEQLIASHAKHGGSDPSKSLKGQVCFHQE
jgi:hypothetical protein